MKQNVEWIDLGSPDDCKCGFDYHNKLPVIIEGVWCFIEKKISNGMSEYRLDKGYDFPSGRMNWVDTMKFEVKCMRCQKIRKY